MAKKPSAEPTFPEIIEGSAPNVEDFSSAYSNRDASPVPGARKIPASDPSNPYDIGFTALDFTFHHEVFVIWRAWNACSRCTEAVKAGRATIPEDGDYVCPHTRCDAYVKTVQEFLTKGHIQQSRQENMLQDGSIQISLAWLVPKINQRKIKEIMARGGSNTSEGSAT